MCVLAFCLRAGISLESQYNWKMVLYFMNKYLIKLKALTKKENEESLSLFELYFQLRRHNQLFFVSYSIYTYDWKEKYVTFFCLCGKVKV